MSKIIRSIRSPFARLVVTAILAAAACIAGGNSVSVGAELSHERALHHRAERRSHSLRRHNDCPPPVPSPGLEFATSILSYDPGTGSATGFQNPQTALGAPSETNPFGEAVDPFNPPYGTNQIVSIGAGGHLTLGFRRPILNHPRHPFGLDFTVFGNTGFIVTNEFDLTTFDWIGTPATDGSLFGDSTGEIVVSVSPDGRRFYVLDPAQTPRVDSFPPADAAGDPTLPISPELSAGDLAGATLDDIATLYDGSAGGASFDLSTALDADGRCRWLPYVRFVRIDVLSGRAEVDAVTAVAPAPWRRR